MAGYRVISEAVAAAIAPLVPELLPCLYALAGNDSYFPVLLTREGLWYFGSTELIGQNGWRLDGGLRPLDAPRACCCRA